MMLLWKRHLCSNCPSFERSGGNATAFGVPAYPFSSHCVAA